MIIVCQVLQADGSNQSACINAVTLALIDAGIPMKDYVSASTVSFVNDTPLMDINYLEESSGGPKLSPCNPSQVRKDCTLSNGLKTSHG